MSVVYYHKVPDFFAYLSDRGTAEAVVLSAKDKTGRRSNRCDINYAYSVGSEQYYGKGSIVGSCSVNIRKINIFYLKHKPAESVIGFYVLGMLIPIFFLFIPLLFIRRFRNIKNRTKFCIYDIVLGIAYIIIAIVFIVSDIVSPLALNDIVSQLICLCVISICFVVMYNLYKNIIRYNLYKNGQSIQGKITSIKEKIGNKKVVSREIFYEYESNSYRHNGSETLTGKESFSYGKNGEISLLLHPNKKHISCLDI